MRIQNVEIANTLNLSQSAISRMRTGDRSASLETMQVISMHYGVPMMALVSAAAKFKQGDKTEWVALLAQAFDDGEADPDVLEA